MSEFSAHFEVFSPKWGHTDPYSVKFTAEEMHIYQSNFSAVCKLAENGDPEWTGYRAGTGNPLMKIFSNNSIYAPEIVGERVLLMTALSRKALRSCSRGLTRRQDPNQLPSFGRVRFDHKRLTRKTLWTLVPRPSDHHVSVRHEVA